MQCISTKIPRFGNLLLLAVIFCSFSLQAQVGIGNTDPDPSSAVDITSVNQGLLVPRMNSFQRGAIVNPANSLLVYDTTFKAYFYYDATSLQWIKINSDSIKRENYKLVKSVSDLAPELTQGGGSKYVLQTNTFYEINGTINLAFPIDLNNAYVSGLDAHEDILSFPGGTIFKGSTGGSIKNVTLRGKKGFEIAGPGISTSSSLIVRSLIIEGMSDSVGSISALGLYFSDVIQFINNANGITYSDIGNLLLNNQGWLGNNSGTYEKLTGSFGLVEKISGFSTANGTTVALDVSSNPIVGTGVILATVFSGSTFSGYINGYSIGSYAGYNFSNNWTVDCAGIPREGDNVAVGNVTLNAPNAEDFFTTTFTGGAGNRKKLYAGLNTITAESLYRFDKATGPGEDGFTKIIYKGVRKRYFQVNAVVSYQPTSNQTGLIFYIAKNGNVVTQTKVTNYHKISDNVLTVPIIGKVELEKNDNLEIWVERYSGSGNVKTFSLNLSVY